MGHAFPKLAAVKRNCRCSLRNDLRGGPQRESVVRETCKFKLRGPGGIDQMRETKRAGVHVQAQNGGTRAALQGRLAHRYSDIAGRQPRDLAW